MSTRGVTQESLTVLRRPGRPRVAEPVGGSSVTAWIPPKDHDRLVRIANAAGMSVSECVRSLVAVVTRR